MNLRNARHARTDPRPLDPDCVCPTCRRLFSRAYLHHLFKAGEMLGPILLTWHNLQHFQDLMRDIRSAVETGGFAVYRREHAAAEAAFDPQAA